jgi:hypothetical protein
MADHVKVEADLRLFQERIGSMLIVDLIARHPESKQVLFNHFGASCFACPGRVEETVTLGVRVHRAEEEEFYRDLAAAIAPIREK